MAIIYDKLFALLEQQGINKGKIRRDNIISQSALQKMKDGTGHIDTRTIERLCHVLHCQPGDLMEYVEE